MSHTFTLVFAAAGALFFTALLAVVSASEQVFLSLTEAQLRRLKERGHDRMRHVTEFVRRPHQVIVTTTLSGSVFFAGAILCVLLLVSGAEPVTPGNVLGVGLLAGLLLSVLGRSLPRTLASMHPTATAFHLVGVFSVVETLFQPLSWLVRWLIGRVSDDAAGELVAAGEFKAVASEDEEAPRLEEEKRELLHSIFEFGGTTAKEVMVPRIDMIMAAATTSRREVLTLISSHGHSRIPIYDESVDKILGVAHVKELVKDGRVDGDDTPIREFIREVMFVPETKKIDELLREFQEKRTHLAIVVDEYGGTSGMVTLEDVLEEIVGEIEDEYDRAEKLFETLSDGTVRVAAKIDLDDLNEEMNLQIPTENSDTLGGFIYELVGKVPSPGDEVDHQGFTFTIDRVHRQRIVRVLIRRKEQARA
ncbi:MAG: gliding motility protein GldE [Gemmatimonadota bacterium]|nr:MAG: gliding motility protein GldE [Gemmatimonadota bacterium]